MWRIFNLIEKNPRRNNNKKIIRVRRHNYAKYGAARMAFRREAVQSSGISFNLSFGGGARYGSGEDTVFLKECLDKGLRIYAVPYFLAEIDQEAGALRLSAPGHLARIYHSLCNSLPQKIQWGNDAYAGIEAYACRGQGVSVRGGGVRRGVQYHCPDVQFRTVS